MVTRHKYWISALVSLVNQWWRRQMSVVFFGYLFDIQELQQANRKQNIIKHHGLFKAWTYWEAETYTAGLLRASSFSWKR